MLLRVTVTDLQGNLLDTVLVSECTAGSNAGQLAREIISHIEFGFATVDDVQPDEPSREG